MCAAGHTSPVPPPSTDDARRIVHAALGYTVAEIRRFPMGLAHFVYDVRTREGPSIVVRLARAGQTRGFRGALYWYTRLTPLGVPLPALLYADADGRRHGFPAMIIERLPGVDLGEVYSSLTAWQKRTIAEKIVVIQRRVASLPLGPGFGYATTYEDPSLKPTWAGVVHAELERSRRRIEAVGAADMRLVDRVQAAIERHRPYLDRVQPVCFLDDTTTKNVIVHDGELNGIVDVDVGCFGDPLCTPALTRMALLSRGHDTDYVTYWTDALDLTAEQQAMLTLYTAMYCVGFLAEIGQQFNKDRPAPVDIE